MKSRLSQLAIIAGLCACLSFVVFRLGAVGQDIAKTAKSKASLPRWEFVMDEKNVSTYRSKVPGGWLVLVTATGGRPDAELGVAFVPDPQHSWKNE